MADVELVIKIPKRVYNYIRKYEHIANSDVLDIKDAIINGTPLPKGHGRLIDESKITKCYMPVNRLDVRGIRTDAPTIIEAESERGIDG